MASEVSVHDCLAPLLGVCSEREHQVSGSEGKGACMMVITKQRERKVIMVPIFLSWAHPSDLHPLTKSQFLSFLPSDATS